MGPPLPDLPGYDVEAEIGRGGMGVVYRARRHSDGQALAVKMILRGRGASFADLARFRIEAEALACLRHPNIVKIRDIGVYAGYPYFAMQFAEGGSLKDATARGPQSPAWAAGIVKDVALAMRHSHERGMLHRDLKPANVLLTADGVPVVTDFGLVKFATPFRSVSEMYCTMSASVLDAELARFARESGLQYRPGLEGPAATDDLVTRSIWEQCASRTGALGDISRLEAVREFLTTAVREADQDAPGLDGLTEAGAVMGSPGYMAPEQAKGDLDAIGPATDVYAMGGVLYELLTGRPPFRAGSFVEVLFQICSAAPTPPREIVPDLPAGIEAVCMKCLEKSPEARYPTAGDLAADLGRFLEGSPPLAAERTSRPTRSAIADLPPTVPHERAPTTWWWPFGKSRRRARHADDPSTHVVDATSERATRTMAQAPIDD